MPVAEYTPRNEPNLHAVLWTGNLSDLDGMPDADWLRAHHYLYKIDGSLAITDDSRETRAIASIDKDYIVRGITGHFFVMEKEAFEYTYCILSRVIVQSWTLRPACRRPNSSLIMHYVPVQPSTEPPIVFMVLEWLDGVTRVPIAVCETLQEAQGMCNAFREVVGVPWSGMPIPQLAMPQPDWSKAPTRAMWWAINPDGLEVWGEHEGNAFRGKWQDVDEKGDSWAFCITSRGKYVDLPVGVDYRTTLQRRPQEIGL